jgi:cytochrome P450
MIAGSETSTTLLSGCIFYLCKNHRILSQLVHEIRSTFQKAEVITCRSSATPPYLAAVIEESLRIYPLFVTNLSRLVPAGGASIDAHFVPEGVRSPQSLCFP